MDNQLGALGNIGVAGLARWKELQFFPDVISLSHRPIEVDIFLHQGVHTQIGPTKGVPQ